jgi:glycolate oxidase
VFNPVLLPPNFRSGKRLGLFYPPDPSSASISTIGGNLAECAGGPKAVKYGVTRDYVLGIETVLPTGEIIKTGVRTAKGVVGYDLTRLIVGSEGTLALITEAT